MEHNNTDAWKVTSKGYNEWDCYFVHHGYKGRETKTKLYSCNEYEILH